MLQAAKLGELVTGWTVPQKPIGTVLEGQSVRLEPLDADSHAADLFRAYSGHDSLWDYMYSGPFSSASAFHRYCKDSMALEDMCFYAMRDKTTGLCGGMASYLRIAPDQARSRLAIFVCRPKWRAVGFGPNRCF